MSYGTFEAAATDNFDQEQHQRAAGKALEAAIFDVRTQFGGFLAAAVSHQDFEDRLALTKPDMMKTVAAHIDPVTGVMNKVVKACKPDLRATSRLNKVAGSDFAAWSDAQISQVTTSLNEAFAQGAPVPVEGTEEYQTLAALSEEMQARGIAAKKAFAKKTAHFPRVAKRRKTAGVQEDLDAWKSYRDQLPSGPKDYDDLESIWERFKGTAQLSPEGISQIEFILDVAPNSFMRHDFLSKRKRANDKIVEPCMFCDGSGEDEDGSCTRCNGTGRDLTSKRKSAAAWKEDGKGYLVRVPGYELSMWPDRTEGWVGTVVDLQGYEVYTTYAADAGELREDLETWLSMKDIYIDAKRKRANDLTPDLNDSTEELQKQKSYLEQTYADRFDADAARALQAIENELSSRTSKRKRADNFGEDWLYNDFQDWARRVHQGPADKAALDEYLSGPEGDNLDAGSSAYQYLQDRVAKRKRADSIEVTRDNAYDAGLEDGTAHGNMTKHEGDYMPLNCEWLRGADPEVHRQYEKGFGDGVTETDINAEAPYIVPTSGIFNAASKRASRRKTAGQWVEARPGFWEYDDGAYETGKIWAIKQGDAYLATYIPDVSNGGKVQEEEFPTLAEAQSAAIQFSLTSGRSAKRKRAFIEDNIGVYLDDDQWDNAVGQAGGTEYLDQMWTQAMSACDTPEEALKWVADKFGITGRRKRADKGGAPLEPKDDFDGYLDSVDDDAENKLKDNFASRRTAADWRDGDAHSRAYEGDKSLYVDYEGENGFDWTVSDSNTDNELASGSASSAAEAKQQAEQALKSASRRKQAANWDLDELVDEWLWPYAEGCGADDISDLKPAAIKNYVQKYMSTKGGYDAGTINEIMEELNLEGYVSTNGRLSRRKQAAGFSPEELDAMADWASDLGLLSDSKRDSLSAEETVALIKMEYPGGLIGWKEDGNSSFDSVETADVGFIAKRKQSFFRGDYSEDMATDFDMWCDAYDVDPTSASDRKDYARLFGLSLEEQDELEKIAQEFNDSYGKYPADSDELYLNSNRKR